MMHVMMDVLCGFVSHSTFVLYLKLHVWGWFVMTMGHWKLWWLFGCVASIPNGVTGIDSDVIVTENEMYTHSDSCDIGDWINQNSGSKDRSYIPSSRLSFEDGIESWLESACPFESMLSSCYFNLRKNESSRARVVENRRWVAKDPSKCYKFWPIDMLNAVSNRVVYFAGDSTVRELFQYFVCSVYSVTAHEYRIKWIREGNVNCPSPSSSNQHCRLQDMMIYFPSMNTTFRYMGAGYEHWKVTSELLNLLFHYKVSSNDIMIVNWGLHGGDQLTYKRTVEGFVSAVAGRITSENRSIPTTLFLETLPQHFQTENGYFENEAAKLPCTAFSNVTTQWQLDWRNRFVNDIFSKSEIGIKVVSTAKILYSQYDTHIGYRSSGNNFYDCTHVCFHSGVHDFILTKIFNTLVDLRSIYPPTSASQNMIASDKNPYVYNFNGLLTPYPDNSLLRADNDRTIFLIIGESRHAFTSQRAFLSRGFDFSNVRVISEFDMENIPLGDPLY